MTNQPTGTSQALLRSNLKCFHIAAQLDARTMQVTELPIRRWTQDYKEFLEVLFSFPVVATLLHQAEPRSLRDCPAFWPARLLLLLLPNL